MKPWNRLSFLLLFAVGVMLPVGLGAQGARIGETPGGRPATNQQMSGEAVFCQNCTFCHERSAQKRALIPQFLGPTLIGLLDQEAKSCDCS